MRDLVIHGGTIVTAGGVGEATVGVEDGMVVQIGGQQQGRREIDASGKYVLPGGVDVHVHFSPFKRPEPGAELQVDDFWTGSQAALAGGITTIGNMVHQWQGETLHQAIARDMSAAKRDAAVDFILHPVLSDPTGDGVSEVAQLAAEGHGSLKLFLTHEAFDRHIDLYLDAMHTAATHGMLTLIHCEDGPIIRFLRRRLLATGQTSARYYPDSRPAYTEALAIARAIAYGRATGAPIYVVHLASSAALAECRRARAEGLPVYVETRPLYLYLTRERFSEPDAGKYVGNPPLREAADIAAIWDGLRSGEVQCVCSDHAPWTLGQKLDPALDVTTLRAGVSDLETMLPMLFSAGVRTGRLPIERFVAVTSTNPAKLFGLYPRKGTIAPGGDADLVVWDPAARRKVDGRTMYSRAGYTVYDGTEVSGWPVLVVRRGDVVFEDGNVTAERGRGRWLPAAARVSA